MNHQENGNIGLTCSDLPTETRIFLMNAKITKSAESLGIDLKANVKKDKPDSGLIPRVFAEVSIKSEPSFLLNIDEILPTIDILNVPDSRQQSRSTSFALTVPTIIKSPEARPPPTGKESKMLQFKPIESKLIKAPTMLTPAQKKEIEQIFQLFDTDGSGTMETGELKVVLWALGFQPEPGETEQMISEFFHVPLDEVGEFSLTLKDFLQLMMDKLVSFH